MKRLRTPDERFINLPDFDFPVQYETVSDPTGDDDLRVAYFDLGPRDAKETVLLLHGEPSWSFLYRKMFPGLLAAGYRVVAPDLLGFGRSDKPTPRSEYTYARHVAWMGELLFDKLNLSNITFFGQDWGSLIGLRLVAEHPERFSRVAIGNGGLPTGDEKTNEAFEAWQKFSQEAPELPIAGIVGFSCAVKPTDEVFRGYDAPFPDETYKEGARIFPLLVPSKPDDPAHDANVAAWEVLKKFEKPFLCCYSDSDPITKGADRKFLAQVPGTKGQAHVTVAAAGHFLQEDKGEELSQILVRFIAST